MIIDISIAVIAAAFLVLAIYLILTLRTLRTTLCQAKQTLAEAKKTLEQTHEMGIDLQRKMESLDPLFNAVENLGDVLECETATYRERKYLACHQSDEEDDAVNTSDVVALASLGLKLWNKFSKRR